MSENTGYNCRIANLYNVTNTTEKLKQGEIVFYSSGEGGNTQSYTRMKVGDGTKTSSQLDFAEHPKTARLDKNLVYYDATNSKLQYLKNGDNNNDVNVEITDLALTGNISASTVTGTNIQANTNISVGNTSSTSASDLVSLNCYDSNEKSLGTVSLRCDLNTAKDAVAGLNIYKTVGKNTSQGGLHAAFVDTDVLYINNSTVIDSNKNITTTGGNITASKNTSGKGGNIIATETVSGNNLNLNKKIVGHDLGAANAPIQLITNSSSDEDYGKFPLIAIKKNNLYYIVSLYIDSEGHCSLDTTSNNG